MTRIPLAKPYIDENDIKAVVQTLSSSALSRGPKVKQFEAMFKNLTQCEYA